MYLPRGICIHNTSSHNFHLILGLNYALCSLEVRYCSAQPTMVDLPDAASWIPADIAVVHSLMMFLH